MATITISSKGQVVLPADIRKRLGLTSGMQIEVIEEAGSLRLIPAHSIAASSIASCAGMITAPTSGKPRNLADFDAASLMGREQHESR